MGRIRAIVTTAAASEPIRVAVFVRHGVMPLELGAVHQLFRQARSPTGDPLYEVVTCAAVPGFLRSDADFEVRVEHGPEAVARCDTLIVPASHEEDERLEPAALAAAYGPVLSRARPGTRIASVCTGAFLLAAVGLLEGRVATTHWKSAAHLRRVYPGVRVDENVLYTDNGDVLTAAGEAAGIDLCLHMIRSDHGASVANEVARATVVPPHREGGQAQFVPNPVTRPAAGGTGPAREWALDHLADPLALSDLAARVSMSVRTFTRRFRLEVGTSPSRWLTRQRVERARELLERTDLPVEAVARAVGLGTAPALRHHLRAVVGVSPDAYRRTFRGS
ncbi:Transcriptional regulator GlxA family, contains an amidase domain and an AraC-type DNA-binding HTH domain [Actinoalloteichus cyanogriseus DSM 43889]|uniref:Transcriptional regulator GlxA family, contains an amidase domain and an AraC-type DNA-binding HTH domain n=2 Tax=Pseudonocardiaceae TaxID=2070 RepID=A0ABT1JE28_ACTCY|nr:helix-turn-helix domain-containing protein [Actinoalloteichus caeruleus]MCP2330464.1 Transcriptional regulator GlxA family, contains an amidase domain and an AraC-type DNA-binding HTH domain [Actinoalloteichus caeruleus DSM 43889]